MRAFLGKRLENILQVKEVETEGRDILVAGPLSEVFTKALNEELRKDKEEVTPVVESFTDSESIIKLITQHVEDRSKSTKNPLMIYAFDKRYLSDKIVVEAITAATTNNRKDVVIISNNLTDYTPDVNYDCLEDKSKFNNNKEYLEMALEAALEKLNCCYIDNSSSLKSALESFDD